MIISLINTHANCPRSLLSSREPAVVLTMIPYPINFPSNPCSVFPRSLLGCLKPAVVLTRNASPIPFPSFPFAKSSKSSPSFPLSSPSNPYSVFHGPCSVVANPQWSSPGMPFLIPFPSYSFSHTHAPCAFSTIHRRKQKEKRCGPLQARGDHAVLTLRPVKLNRR